MALWLIKLISGLLLAFILARVGQEFVKYGMFSFVFILISITGGFMALVKPLKFLSMSVVLLLLISFFVLLRFYVVWAYQS